MDDWEAADAAVARRILVALEHRTWLMADFPLLLRVTTDLLPHATRQAGVALQQADIVRALLDEPRELSNLSRLMQELCIAVLALDLMEATGDTSLYLEMYEDAVTQGMRYAGTLASAAVQRDSGHV